MGDDQPAPAPAPVAAAAVDVKADVKKEQINVRVVGQVWHVGAWVRVGAALTGHSVCVCVGVWVSGR
jgi:hypothetical protein